MTEPRIRDLLSYVDADRAASCNLAAELSDLAAVALDAGMRSLSRRLEAAALRAAAKVELIDRLLSDDLEDTVPRGLRC